MAVTKPEEDFHWRTQSERIRDLKYGRPITREMVDGLRELAEVTGRFWRALEGFEELTGVRFSVYAGFERFRKAKPKDVRYVCERFAEAAKFIHICDGCDGYLDDHGKCPVCGPVKEDEEEGG